MTSTSRYKNEIDRNSSPEAYRPAARSTQSQKIASASRLWHKSYAFFLSFDRPLISLCFNLIEKNVAAP